MSDSILLPPADIQAEIASLDAELDAIWPGWRGKQPFSHLDVEYQARLKWCLKRRSLLDHREGPVPRPRDWAVKMVYSQSRGSNTGRVFAHPVPPDPGGVAPDPAWFTGPPKLGIVAVSKSLSASQLAVKLSIPLETVEDLLPHAPKGDDDDVCKWLKSQIAPPKKRKKKAAASA